MERSLLRGRSRAWIVVVMLYLAACTTTGYVPLSKSTPRQTILGVVKKDGERITFAGDSALLGRDTLYAVSGGESLRVPTDSIQSLLVERPSPGKTWGLVGGIVLGTLTIIGLVQTARTMQGMNGMMR